MVALLFYTHKAVKDLQEAGFDEAQAEAVVATVGTAIIGNVATKQDVADALNATKQTWLRPVTNPSLIYRNWAATCDPRCRLWNCESRYACAA